MNVWSFFDLVKSRQSVRSYKNDKVDREIVEKIIDGARVAPSACNSQPWKFIVVDNTEVREALVLLFHWGIVKIMK